MAFDRAGFDKEVGLLLQLARKRREITQAEIAKQIGLPRASYANIESGRQRIPVDVLWRAAVVLNVSISSLVPEPANRSPLRHPNFPAADNLFSKSGAVLSTPASVASPYYGISSFPTLQDAGVVGPWSSDDETG
jgi:transcriptional regulator with XRE-family HTH domain